MGADCDPDVCAANCDHVRQTGREVLSLRTTGLGPTIPGVDPGKPFPASPPAVVNFAGRGDG